MIYAELWYRSGSAASEFFDLVRGITPSSSPEDISRMWELAYRLKQFPEVDLSYFNKRLQELESQATSRSSARSLTELWWLAQHLSRLPRIPKTTLYSSPKRMLPYYPVFQTLTTQPGKPPLGYLVSGEIHMLEDGEFPQEALQQATYKIRLDDLVREVGSNWKVLKDHGSGDLHIYKIVDVPGQRGIKVPISVVLNVPLELKESPAFHDWL